MREMRLKGKFHIVYIFSFIRYGLFLCLIPMVQAVLRFDMPSLYTALRQDALILVGMTVVALYLWQTSGFRLTNDTLVLRTGLFASRQTILPYHEVAVIELQRPIWLRMMGATRVILYASSSAHFTKEKLFLSKAQAAALAECMMPVKSDTAFYQPTGAERVAFTVLSANIITTSALLWVSARETGRIFGTGFEEQLSELALDNLTWLEQWVELILPAGLAWLFTLGFVVWGLALFWSLLSTANFKACRSGGVILSKGGHVNHSERRILASAISWCDVRTTPTGRLLGRRAVYIAAGAYTKSDIPLVVYAPGKEALVQALLPHFLPCPFSMERVGGRSLPQYIWLSGSAFGLCLALFCVSLWQLPQVSLLLSLPTLLCLGLLAASIEAFFCEGVGKNQNHTLSVQYTKGFTRHSLCIFSHDISLSTRQTPFSETVARCNLTLHFPCQKRVTVRSVRQYSAEVLKLD